ncbi:MAG: hypothetical protein WDM87_14035 [Terracidiphilus sp.]
MKAAIVFFCLGLSAFALQKEGWGQQPGQNRVVSACGPVDVNYKVSLDRSQHGPTAPEARKALVYFLHDDGSGVGGTTLGSPTTKYSVDGAWVGANHGNSWFAVAVAPGEHHVCSVLQSSLIQRLELAHFTAEAGKSYFFRARLFVSGSAYLLDFEPADSDEASYLISLYPMARPPRKSRRRSIPAPSSSKK